MIKKTSSTSSRYTLKGLITAGMILGFIIPMALIMNLVEERKERQDEAIENIAQSYSRPQTLAGPYLVIPTTRIVNNGKNTTTISEHKILLPQELKVDGKIDTDTKKRGIYKVPIYSSKLNHKGYFNLSEIKSGANETILWQSAKIAYSLSDARGFVDVQQIQVNGKEYKLDNNLNTENSLLTNGIFAPIALDPTVTNYSYDLSLKVKGSQAIKFTPLGMNTVVNINSDYENPSFDGNFLPEHNLDTNGFIANWKVGNINRAFPQVWHNVKYKILDDSFGVRFFQGNNHYVNTERSVKYAILFIGLTFGFFFLLEILQGKKVHPIQYLLVGLSLIIFYSLLLSIGEYTGFTIAYIMATIGTVGLITLYCKQLFHKWSNALMIGIFLLILYSFIFIIIQMEEYNLLAGSVGLFILIAIAMYMSRKIDWYRNEADEETIEVKENQFDSVVPVIDREDDL